MIPKRQKTLLWLMFLALTLLLLGQVTGLLWRSGPATATARLYSGEESVRVTGTVIRQETVLYFPHGGSWTAAVDSGEKVAAGQTLFTGASTPADTAREVRVLRAGTSAAGLPLPEQSRQLHEAIAILNTAEASERGAAAEQTAALMMARQGEEALAPALEQAQQKLREQATAAENVTAPESGIFAAHVDGLEAVLTPETPDAEWMLPEKPAGTLTAGRLITGDTWYYRVELPFVPEVGETLRLELANGIFAEVSMTVETVTETAEGSRVLLSCRQQLEAVAEIRNLTAKILKDSETGLEIPARAVYTVGEETGVWCLEGDSPCWKPVTVIKELEDTVIVQLDRSTTAGLWPGDTVLLEQP